MTTDPGGARVRAADRVGRPIRRRYTALAVLAAGWAACTLVSSSQPGATGFGWDLCWWIALPAVVVAWAVLGLGLRGSRRGDDATSTRQDRRVVVAVAVIVLLTAGLCATELPWRARWWAARPFFDDAVTTIHDGTSPEEFIGSWVGPFHVWGASPRREGDLFFWTARTVTGAAGFLWSATDSPGRYEYYKLHHISGRWYWVN